MGNAPARIRCYVMELLPFSFTFNLILLVSMFILHFDTFFHYVIIYVIKTKCSEHLVSTIGLDGYPF